MTELIRLSLAGIIVSLGILAWQSLMSIQHRSAQWIWIAAGILIVGIIVNFVDAMD